MVRRCGDYDRVDNHIIDDYHGVRLESISNMFNWQFPSLGL